MDDRVDDKQCDVVAAARSDRFEGSFFLLPQLLCSFSPIFRGVHRNTTKTWQAAAAVQIHYNDKTTDVVVVVFGCLAC